MKRLMLIFAAGFLAHSAFSQCAFTSKYVSRHDQYSISSQKNIKASQNAMDKQIGTFQNKKRYQANVKPVSKKRRSKAMY